MVTIATINAVRLACFIAPVIVPTMILALAYVASKIFAFDANKALASLTYTLHHSDSSDVAREIETARSCFVRAARAEESGAPHLEVCAIRCDAFHALSRATAFRQIAAVRDEQGRFTPHAAAARIVRGPGGRFTRLASNVSRMMILPLGFSLAVHATQTAAARTPLTTVAPSGWTHCTYRASIQGDGQVVRMCDVAPAPKTVKGSK